MNLFQQIANYFKPYEPKTIVVTGAEPGDVIPVDSPEDKIIFLPCPLLIRMAGACICITCEFIDKDCPMERLCRSSGCETSFIGGCTNFTNTKDKNFEEKRKIFREGSRFDNIIFRFSGKESKL